MHFYSADSYRGGLEASGWKVENKDAVGLMF
jgi:hypothetical protein